MFGESFFLFKMIYFHKTLLKGLKKMIINFNNTLKQIVGQVMVNLSNADISSPTRGNPILKMNIFQSD